MIIPEQKIVFSPEVKELIGKWREKAKFDYEYWSLNGRTNIEWRERNTAIIEAMEQASVSAIANEGISRRQAELILKTLTSYRFSTKDKEVTIQGKEADKRIEELTLLIEILSTKIKEIENKDCK